jgi:hypothetical protein
MVDMHPPLRQQLGHVSQTQAIAEIPADRVNLVRLVTWLTAVPRATTRVSPFAELALAAP